MLPAAQNTRCQEEHWDVGGLGFSRKAHALTYSPVALAIPSVYLVPTRFE
jgi:hypothetical protein